MEERYQRVRDAGNIQTFPESDLDTRAGPARDFLGLLFWLFPKQRVLSLLLLI